MARQRRGLLGSTNLAAQPRDCGSLSQPGVGSSLRHSEASQEATASPPGHRRRPAGAAAGEQQKAGSRDGSAAGEAERSPAARIPRRDKFRLPLISGSGSYSGASVAANTSGCSTTAESLSAEVGRAFRFLYPRREALVMWIASTFPSLMTPLLRDLLLTSPVLIAVICVCIGSACEQH